MRKLIVTSLPMRLIAPLLLVCYLAGCSAPNTNNLAAGNSTAASQANRYFKLAENSQGAQAIDYLLQGTEQLLIAGQTDAAAELLYTPHDAKMLTPNQTAYKKILQAQLALAKRDPHTAQQLLRGVWAPQNLPEDLQAKFFTTRSEAYLRSGNLLQSIQERINLSHNLSDEMARRHNNQVIWDSFSQLTPATLRSMQSMQQPNQSTELTAWLAFANIMKQYDSNSTQMLQALQMWRQKYPQHPATAFLPHAVLEAAPPISKPKKIALLLPLQGKHATSAQAVRDGFLAAYYAQPAADRPKIQVYDTTENSNLSRLYQRAVEDGANFVVGPLIKEEVDAISITSRSNVPVLALNTTDGLRVRENLFHFGLSPEQEAQAVAEKAWHDGHRNAMIIIPQSPWGERMKEAFSRQWQRMGGSILAVEQIHAQSNINAETKKLLAIDLSEARAEQIKALGIDTDYIAHRRQDPDMIFMATNAPLARQIKPLLNFYYAANVPTYAPSSIYSGKSQPQLDQDLNGIKFCDMPWVLDQSISSRATYKAVANLWPDKFEQYGKLYALGLDAYKVAMQMDQLTMLPDLGISGMTGMLTLDQRQQVQRKLMWASFKKGIATIDGNQ